MPNAPRSPIASEEAFRLGKACLAGTMRLLQGSLEFMAFAVLVLLALPIWLFVALSVAWLDNEDRREING